MAEADGPVFIVGSDRSGSTLLRLLLDANPELTIPPESWFLRELLDRFPPDQPLEDEQLTAAGEVISTHSRWRHWHVSEDQLQLLIGALRQRPGPTLPGDLIDAVFRAETGVGPHGRWGDKTPDYGWIIPEIHAIFPRAHFVCIVRDGRDVYLSLRSRGWRGTSISRIMRHWSRGIRLWDEARVSVPEGQLTLVRYEDLVTDPEPTLSGLCERIDLDYKPEMLDFHRGAADRITTAEHAERVHTKVQSPISPSDVERWRTDLRPPRRWFVESAAWDELRLRGYEPTIGPHAASVMAQTLRISHGLARRVRTRSRT